jgi:hypothetical protein
MSASSPFTWGRVVARHYVGEYEIVEFVPNKAVNISQEEYDRRLAEHPTSFHPFINGKDTNHGYNSLDHALVGAIALKRDGLNTRADTYFMRAVGENDPDFGGKW